MSDARLRELERRWKETGSPDDEAAYLLECVRVGDLTRERLELAAYCGHEGACKALGAWRGDESPRDFRDWIKNGEFDLALPTICDTMAVCLVERIAVTSGDRDERGSFVAIALDSATRALAKGQPVPMDLVRGAFLKLRGKEWTWSFHLDHGYQAAVQAGNHAREGNLSGSRYVLGQVATEVLGAGIEASDVSRVVARAVAAWAIGSVTAG